MLDKPTKLRGLLVAILFAAAALYLIGNDRVNLFDRDEPRYAQTSRQMLESGDWVVPKYLDEVRTAKPAFIYWCQANAMRLFGVNEFAARLPSVIAMLLTLTVLAAAVWRGIGPARAVWTVFIFSTCALAIAAAKMAITDAVLLLWITIAQVCLYAIYAGRSSRAIAALMWAAIGLAVLTKGPVVFAVQGSTLLVLAILDRNRPWRQRLTWVGNTHPLLGTVIVLAIVTPWLVAIQLREPAFLSTTLWHDVFTRTVRPLEGHKGPPGFYLLAVWATFFPWSLLLPTTATIAWKHRKLPPIRFAIAAVVGPWIVFELVQTKLVHYVLPAYPPLAFLAADALVRCIRKQHDDLHRPIFTKVTLAWAFAGLAALAIPWLAIGRYGDLPPILYIAKILITIIGGGYVALVLYHVCRRRIGMAAAIMGGGMIAVIALFFGLYLPNAQFLWVPRRTADVLRQHGAFAPGDVVMVDFKEDSLAYYQGGTIRRRDNSFLLTESTDRWPTWIVLTRDLWSQLSPDRAARLQHIASIQGWAYADHGRAVEVIVAKNVGAPSD